MNLGTSGWMKAIKWIKYQTDQGDFNDECDDTDQLCPWQNQIGQDVFTGLPMIHKHVHSDSEFTTALKLALHSGK